MAWSESTKALPVADIYSEWTRVPADGSHFSAVDETEDDLDVDDYVVAPVVPLTPEEFRFAPPSGYPDRDTFVHDITVRTYHLELGASAGEMRWFLGDKSGYMNLIDWPPGPEGWYEWVSNDIDTVFPVASFDDWSIRLLSDPTGQNWVYVAAIYAFVRYGPPPGLSASLNHYDQRFRMFSTGSDEDLSFERLDMRTGAWSSPIQPFAGDWNTQPSIECLANGHLRAVYLDSDLVLQHAISTDDGETWVMV